MFDGTLGTRKIPPVNLDLKDDSTPMCLRLYPLPRVREAMFRKEFERLLALSVINEANDSELGAPYFD